MGKLIDADILERSLTEIDEHINMDIFTNEVRELIDNAPTVEAIPKAEYEARLKAEKVAMLTELMVGIVDHIMPSNHTDSYDDGWSEGAEWCVDYIQEKIDKLKEVGK